MIDEVEEIDVDTNVNLPSGVEESPSQNGGSSKDSGDNDGQNDGEQDGSQQGGSEGDEQDDKESQDSQNGDEGKNDGQDQDGQDQDGKDGDNQEDQNEGDEGDEKDGGDEKESEQDNDQQDKESKDDGDGENQEDDSGSDEVFSSLSIEIAQDVAKSFKDKGYANRIDSKGGTFMYLWEILFGPSFRNLYATLNEVDGLTKTEIEDIHKNDFTYDELLEFDKQVAKKMLRTMRDYPNYFDVENAYGHILYDTLEKIFAFSFYNFQYYIERGEKVETMCLYNDENYKILAFVNSEYSINKTFVLKFDSKQKLTNFALLYSNDEELNNLWIILHQLNIELLPFTQDQSEWLNNVTYQDFNTIIATKLVQQLKTLQNAII